MSAQNWVKDCLAQPYIHSQREMSDPAKRLREHHDANCPAHLAVRAAAEKYNAVLRKIDSEWPAVTMSDVCEYLTTSDDESFFMWFVRNGKYKQEAGRARE